MTRDRGICVIIPTYNNAGTVVDVVSRTLLQCPDVFVVCDGCTDDTVSLLENMPQKPRMVVLEKNRGKGAALKAGFRAALDEGFAYAITLDADGQHYPEDIPLFVEANIKFPGALIVGERKGLEGVERSAGSSFANKFSNFWFFVQTLHHLNDTQTGYRLYPLHKLHGLGLLTSRYEAELELLVFAAWHGVEIESIAVNVYYPAPEDRVSHFRPGRDFARISALNVVLCVLALVYALPLAIVRFLVRLLSTVIPLLIFITLALVLFTPAAFIYLSVGKKTEHKKEVIHACLCRLNRVALRIASVFGVKYSLHNPYNEDFSRPAIIICNHQSHLDLLPMMALTPKLVIITADWVWNNPLYGYIIRNIDFLPASKGIETLAPELKALADKGYSVAIYPEGTRSTDCSIGRFHQGAFYLAEELGVDILPVVLYGSGRALPKHAKLLRRWPMRLEIDRRISPGELRLLGDSSLSRASAMRAGYRTRYGEIADEMEKTQI